MLYTFTLVVLLCASVASFVHTAACQPLQRTAPFVKNPGEDRDEIGESASPEKFRSALHHAPRITDAAGLQRPAYALPEATNAPLWRNIGPFYKPGMAGAGRASDVAVNPKNTATIYLATASGGVWKTQDDGRHWLPVTDSFAFSGVSAVVIDPKDTNIVYVATGDSYRWTYPSTGIMRSTDGGASWSPCGTMWTTVADQYGGYHGIRRISIDPDSTNHLVVTTNDGIFTTYNGGASWNQSFAGTWFSELERHPTKHRMLFASNDDNNAANGIFYKSIDGGRTWTHADSGLAARKGFRATVRISRSNPRKLYAAVFDDWVPAYIYTSYNEGASWQLVGDTSIYFNHFAVDPRDSNTIYGSSYEHWKSRDGGKTWDSLNTVQSVHCDHWTTYVDADHTIYDCTDGGLWRKRDSDTSWHNMNASICAFEYYSMSNALSDTVHVMTGSQDNCGQYRYGPEPADWKHGIFHGDAMICAVDYTHPGTVYSEGIGGSIFRTRDTCVNWTGVRPPETNDGNWVTPFVMDPVAPATLYMGMQHIWKTTDQGATWKTTSDSLPDNRNFDRIAISRSAPRVMFATSDRTIMRTTNGGVRWSEMTALARHPAYPNAFINDIKISPRDPNTVWVAFDGWGANGKVFRSTDAGISWTDMTLNLPNPYPYHAIALQGDSLHGVYVGSLTDVHYKNDTMAAWVRYDAGMPNVYISALEVLDKFGLVRACTWGRGIWEAPVYRAPDPTGVGETPRTPGLSLWPLPAIDAITVESDRAIRSVRVYDLLGRTLRTIAADAAAHSLRIPLDDRTSGTYFIELRTTDNNVRVRCFPVIARP